MRLDCVWDSVGCKDFFIFFRTGLIDVELINSTSGYLEYRSVMTSAYSLFGNGRQKSISMVSHGLSGRLVILAGSV